MIVQNGAEVDGQGVVRSAETRTEAAGREEQRRPMGFEYAARGNTAVDLELGLEISRDPHFWDADATTLLVRALPDGPSWPLIIECDKGERVYQSKTGPQTHRFEVAVHLRRRAVEPIADILARIQPQARLGLGRDGWMEAIRRGVFAYKAQGGAYLKIVPDLTVSIDR